MLIVLSNLLFRCIYDYILKSITPIDTIKQNAQILYLLSYNNKISQHIFLIVIMDPDDDIIFFNNSNEEGDARNSNEIYESSEYIRSNF